MQKNIHHQVKDAINVLGVTLKVSDSLRKNFVYVFSVIPNNTDKMMYKIKVHFFLNTCIMGNVKHQNCQYTRINHGDCLDFITIFFVLCPVGLSSEQK